MQVLATKWFRRFQRKERIDDAALREAIARVELGLVDADLGGGLVKQRVARPRQGRSGGFRTIVAYRQAKRSVFVYRFAKSRRGNLDVADERDLGDYGRMLLGLDETGIGLMTTTREPTEIDCHGQA